MFPSSRVPPWETLYGFSPFVMAVSEGREMSEERVLLVVMRRALGDVMCGKSIST